MVQDYWGSVYLKYFFAEAIQIDAEGNKTKHRILLSTSKSHTEMTKGRVSAQSIPIAIDVTKERFISV